MKEDLNRHIPQKMLEGTPSYKFWLTWMVTHFSQWPSE